MKREFLQEFRVGEQPLPKEVIDAIMAENGRDIQKVKANFADYEDIKAERDTLKAQQGDSTVDGKTAQQWKETYEQLKEDNGDRWADSPYVFVRDDGSAMHPDSITDWLRNFSRKHDLPHIHPHAFRHPVPVLSYLYG